MEITKHDANTTAFRTSSATSSMGPPRVCDAVNIGVCPQDSDIGRLGNGSVNKVLALQTKRLSQEVVAHTHNPSTEGVETGGSLGPSGQPT